MGVGRATEGRRGALGVHAAESWHQLFWFPSFRHLPCTDSGMWCCAWQNCVVCALFHCNRSPCFFFCAISFVSFFVPPSWRRGYGDLPPCIMPPLSPLMSPLFSVVSFSPGHLVLLAMRTVAALSAFAAALFLCLETGSVLPAAAELHLQPQFMLLFCIQISFGLPLNEALAGPCTSQVSEFHIFFSVIQASSKGILSSGAHGL